MAINKIRYFVQHISFITLMYGGRLGINLGSALPCFACPYVAGCGGHCFLMGLQGYLGFGLSLAALNSAATLKALSGLAVFVMLVAVLGKAWCGWVCPFGLLQDWLTAIRQKLGIRDSHVSTKNRKWLDPIKYILLFYLIFTPLLVSSGVLPPDFYLPFCNICPGKSLLPLFVGESKYLALNLDNSVTLGFSVALIVITGITLVGMFFKRRFFCLFCPLLALIHILKPITIFRLSKEPSACIGCGTCRRSCPMDIEAVYLEKKSTDVQTGACLTCATCVDNCPSDSALNLTWFKRIFSSSRLHAARARKK